MITKQIQQRFNLNLIFYTAIVFHVMAWTLLPYYIRYTVSHDTIEAFMWAQHLQWGYDKNPWFIGWVTKLGLWLGGVRGYYFIQQLFVALGLWSLWMLAKKIFNPYAALVAVLILEGCLYFTILVQVNNDNFPLIGLWTLAAYTFYLAIKTDKLLPWIITGVAVGLSLMSKYSTVFFLLPLWVFTIINPQARRIYRSPKSYLAVGIIVLLCVPNVVWLWQHQFVTIKYAVSRSAQDHHAFLYRHVAHTLYFLQRNIINFLPSLVLFALCYPFARVKWQTIRGQFDKQYALVIGLGPLLLITLLSMVFGWSMYWEWGVPLVTFWGLVLVAFFMPQLKPTSLKRFIIAVGFVMLSLTIGYVIEEEVIGAGKGSGDYPVQAMAQQVTQLWHQRYHSKLKYVAGNRYIASYIAYYSKDKPQVFVNWNSLYSPGVKLADVSRAGAVFVQDSYHGTTVSPSPLAPATTLLFPPLILAESPYMHILLLTNFAMHRSHKGIKPVKLLVGLLPPASKR